jgi:hypothetical protein
MRRLLSRARPLSGVSAAAARVPGMRTGTITTLLATLAVAGLLGACSDGGSGSGSEGSGSGSGSEGSGAEGAAGSDGAGQELYDWVDCMRGEGLDQIPDPVRDADGNLVIAGDGFDLGPPTGGPQEAKFGPYSSDEMAAASETCGLPPMMAPGVISDEVLQEQQDNLLAFAECLRENGLDDFPDPDFSDMASPFPGVDDEDPVVANAQEICEPVLAGEDG